MNLYTVEAVLNYDDLPINLKEGWGPSGFMDYVGENQVATMFMSLHGRLCKKCIFIGDEQLATRFADHLQARVGRRGRSMEVKARPVGCNELAYRKKKAADEAMTNDAAIRQILDRL